MQETADGNKVEEEGTCNNHVAADDTLDALVATWTASGSQHELHSIPEAPEFDKCGLRMEMVYRRP